MDALDWASSIVEITEQQKKIIVSANKSLLYKDSVPYKKKVSGFFDVTIGGYPGAENSDLVGLFLLSKVKNLVVHLGAYRNDWLGYSRHTPQQTDIVKKKIQKIFKNHGLKIEIQVNKDVVDILDVTLDTRNCSHQVFTKPNSVPVCVHRQSNHPPSVLQNIPQSVNDRLNILSSSKEKFEAVAPPYQEALEKSGYNHKLEFTDLSGSMTRQPRRMRTTSRLVTYFNPPFSLNVETNIGKEFLKIIRAFPKNNVLAPIVNTNTTKISYQALQNMGGEIS